MSLRKYLDECRELVIDEIRRVIPAEDSMHPVLYELMLDYPLREAKGLRPALCIATCRALGGKLEAVLGSAAVLELFHNAFLIHDDIEDESEMRRGAPTLHREHGIPIAVNVGDAMLCMTLEPLLDNIGLVGLGPALRILKTISDMSRETVEGQAIELDWIKNDVWTLTDDHYVEMVIKKTGYYSFITPVVVGGIASRLSAARLEVLSDYARELSVAFQIVDDLLNLDGELEAYGKEIGGDLWEGKRTLMLIHTLRQASPRDAREAKRILSLPRPPLESTADGMTLTQLLEDLAEAGEITGLAKARITEIAGRTRRDAGPCKTESDIQFLFGLIRRHGSLDYAREIALQHSDRARERLRTAEAWLPRSEHREFLEGLIDYVVKRTR